jgi:hypothetical protein
MTKSDADVLTSLVDAGRRLLWDLEAAAVWLPTFLLVEWFDRLEQTVIEMREEESHVAIRDP